MDNLFQQPMQPWPALAPYARHVQTANGQRLFLYEAGDPDAPALLLLHGLGDEADSWRHILLPLSHQYRVIAPDLPGFGRSEKPQRRYTLPFFQDTVNALVDALGVEKFTLAGSSLGATIALMVALSRPERTSRLVLLDGSPIMSEQPLHPRTMLFLFPGLGERLYNHLRRDAEAAYDTLYPYYSNLELLTEEDRDFLFKRVNQRVWSDGQRRAFLSTLRHSAWWLLRHRQRLQTTLARLEIPTLILWGEQDQIVSRQNGEALAALLPQAHLMTISSSGHLPHQERPGAVVEAIRRETA